MITKRLAETLITFFGNIVTSLNIDDNLVDITRKTGKVNLFPGSNKEYTNNPNKLKIKRKMNDITPVFSFQVCSRQVDNKIQKLDSKEACQEKEMPLH